jgi:dipeptidyl-peptidase-4
MRLNRFALLLLLAPALLAQKKPVTLEALSSGGMSQMMQAMGSQPVWSPVGGRFAYREGRKVMMFDLATKERKELFTTDALEKDAIAAPAERAMAWENRRVAEQRLQWSNDGKKLLIVVNGDLFLWSEASGSVEQLTRTADVNERDPKLSPDGTKVSFRRGYDLYVLDVASRKATRLTLDGSPTRFNAMLDWVYPEELDLGTAHWWSPDSSSIAYLQFDVSRTPLYPHGDHLQVNAVNEPQRYPKAGMPNADVRVGVVRAAGGETRWMDYGETRDHLIARVHWTPDSSNVVTHRLNRVQNHLWILAAQTKTGKAKVLIEETDPAWINLADDFKILSDGRILRGSERDGFRHLYLHAPDGKLIRQITKGEWEASSLLAVDEKAGRLFYTSTEVSPLERHVYSIGLDGSGKKKLTEAAGSNSASMSPAGDAWLHTHSSLDQPSRSVLRRADGSEIAVWREANTKPSEEYELLKTELHQVKTADGALLHARLIKPAGFDASKKYPAVVQVYGGPHAQSVRNSWSGVSMDQVLAHRGFVVWQVDNRGSTGRGHRFETPLYRRLGRQELEDQKEGVKYLVSLGFTDPARIAINGWSYGGYMTLYALLHAPEVFKAGIAGAAVTDWRNYDTIYTERYLGLPEENPDGYKASSPVNAAANLKGRLLLIHNIEDDNVLFGNMLQMMNALQLAGKPFETLLYPQKSHGVTGKARQHMNEQMLRFLESALK